MPIQKREAPEGRLPFSFPKNCEFWSVRTPILIFALVFLPLALPAQEGPRVRSFASDAYQAQRQIVSVNALMTAVNACLANLGACNNVTAPSDALDKGNNNLNFAQAVPCDYSFGE